ncbi:MAG: DUF3306 domain-containing protein [Pseudomonadota bacterium]
MSARSDFWSRRKAQVAAEQEAEAEAVEAAQLAEEHAVLENKSDEEILDELGLPDPETLVAGDDFQAFMAKAVPDRIRRRALRKLWVSNPALANLDGLLDYGEDFTDSSKVIENLQTAYQVGKGMMAHVEELARQAEMQEEVAEEYAEEDGIEPDKDAPNVEPLLDVEPEPALASVPEPQNEDDNPEVAEAAIFPTARRRMHFAFNEETGGAT